MSYTLDEFASLQLAQEDPALNDREQYYLKHPIKDKFNNPLTPQECCEYEGDLWDCGVPASKESIAALWEKWGERLGIPKP